MRRQNLYQLEIQRVLEYRWQYDIYLINLDPTIGSEIQKTRPCLIISPDEQ